MSILPNRLADVLARKARGRRSLAARPIAEKLAILDEMRASLEPLRQIRKVRGAVPGMPREYSALGCADPPRR